MAPSAGKATLVRSSMSGVRKWTTMHKSGGKLRNPLWSPFLPFPPHLPPALCHSSGMDSAPHVALDDAREVAVSDGIERCECGAPLLDPEMRSVFKLNVCAMCKVGRHSALGGARLNS